MPDLNEHSDLSPFVRWVGGKRWLVERLVPEILATKPRFYIEPFLGGGAIALAMPRELPKILADVNPHLMDCWRCIQRLPGSLFQELASVESQYGNELEGYLVARDEFNFMAKNRRPMWVRRSAVFLYLNARCFNGLWRTNAKGLFNVPFGKLASPRKITLAELGKLSARLFNVDLCNGSFEVVLGAVDARWRVAVYADPPYDGTFAGYAKGGFDDSAQRRLSAELQRLWKRGASVWTTNADTPLVREIYSWASIEEISEQHNVGATGERRGKRGCLLIRGKDSR